MQGSGLSQADYAKAMELYLKKQEEVMNKRASGGGRVGAPVGAMPGASGAAGALNEVEALAEEMVEGVGGMPGGDGL